MTGVILVTHGDSGAAMLKSAEQVLGSFPDVRAIGVEMGDTPATVQQRIDREVRTMGVAEVLFLVDLGGSTPANLCCRACAGHSVVLSGLNMAMLFKLSTCDRSRDARDLASELAQTATKSITVREGDGAQAEPASPEGSRQR